MVILAVLSGRADTAVTARAADAGGTIRSRGTLRYEQAVIDAADLQNIQSYISAKRETAAGVLLQLGTKFRQQSGKIVWDRNPDADQTDADLSRLSWPMIIRAAEESQRVPDGLPVLDPEAAMHIEGVEEHTDCYVTAVEDNISRGKAAWADGRLLLGNGADNDRAYQAGLRDGAEGNIPEFVDPLFSLQESSVEIRHAHIGTPGDVEGVSGCYRNYKETRVEEKVCGAALRQTESTWYPNPDEPEGGSWHGGEYTCPTHGGLYASAGTCPQSNVFIHELWHHDVICGLTDALYARLTVCGTDTEAADRAIILTAVLEEGDLSDRFIWEGNEQLVWTDAEGNTLGAGSELSVSSPGIYRCSIMAANEDLSCRTAETMVKVAGFVVKN